MEKMLGGQKFASDTEVHQSFISGLDSSQHHHSLQRAFRSLLTDKTNVLTNLDNMLKMKH